MKSKSIKESDKEVQLAYLSKIKTFSLEEGKTYDKNSYEYRCLKLAIDCYDTTFLTDFASKILINSSLRIKDIAVKDDINFETITLSLASVLPKYKGISDIITKIINQFSDFTKTELSEKVFPIGNKKKDEILIELQTEFRELKNLAQFAFLLFYSKQNSKKYFTDFLISGLSFVDILDFCYKEKFSEINTYVNLGVLNKIFPSEFSLEAENLPSWVLTWLETFDKQEKLNYLALLGVHTENSNIVLLRKFFKTGIGTEIQGKIFSFPKNDIFLVNTLKWLQNATFSSIETAKIENLKHLYSNINFANDIPLLYFQQIETNKNTFILEASAATKYYFENPNKDLEQKIFEVLKSKGYKLLALEYFKNWQSNMPITKIETKMQLDLDNLNKNSNVWDDKAYQQWKATQSQQVFIYNGEKIPYKTIFLEQEIHNSSEGTKIKEGNNIYICQSLLHDIINQLKEYISADELIKLFDNEVISIIRQNNLTVKDIQELLQLKNWLDRERQSSEPIPDSVMKGKSDIEKTGISGEKLVYDFLCNKFGKERVVWASVDENEPRYDFRVLSENSKTVLMYIDAKASITSENASDKVPILIRTRAWNFFKENKEGNFHIARVFNVNNATFEDVKLIQIQMKDL